MVCSLPHTDSEIEALAQRDDLRKTYEKCNDISQESRALICTLLKESSEKDCKLHLSMYRKAKELHQLRMDEEALKEMLEEEAMNKEAQEEKKGLGGLESSEFVHDPQHACFRYQLPLSAILRSPSRQLRENPAIWRSGALCPQCLHEECQSLLPEKVMASGKNGDDGDLLLFRDGPALAQVIGLPERLASQFFLEWNVPWWLPIRGSCQTRQRLADETTVRQWERPLAVRSLEHNGVVPLVMRLRGLADASLDLQLVAGLILESKKSERVLVDRERTTYGKGEGLTTWAEFIPNWGVGAVGWTYANDFGDMVRNYGLCMGRQVGGHAGQGLDVRGCFRVVGDKGVMIRVLGGLGRGGEGVDEDLYWTWVEHG
ncbi:hypothetical protein Tco_0528187 [Tanacetum coccineum]